MLELVPRGLSSRRFVVERDGEEVARISLAWVREAGEIDIEGVPHELRRTGFPARTFELAHGGATVARASKPSALRQRFEIAHDGDSYELVKAAWWTRAFDVRLRGDTVGRIRPHHPFTRRSEVTLPAELGLPFKVFVATLAVLMWNRDSAAAGAGGGAS